MNKVTLPKEVAEAIEHFSSSDLDHTKYGIFDSIMSSGKSVAVTARKVLVDKYEQQCWDVLMQALVVGYEVEPSLEDKVRERYERCRKEAKFHLDKNQQNSMNYWDGAASGIYDTLNDLGITIKGVNE